MSENHLAVKRNISSMQVLKTLQKLLEGDYTMTELIEKLNENEPEPVFNNSVISKYINTCRYCGIEIPKIHNKYFVAKIPFGINFSAREFDLLNEMQTVANSFLSKKANKNFVKLLSSIFKFANRQIVRVEPDTANITRETFEKAVYDEKKIRLMFRAKAEMDCIPLGITEHKGKLYFNVRHNGKDKLVMTERITGLYVLNEKFSQRDEDRTVLFKLTTPLAERYQARAHEEIVESHLPDYIVVKNNGEDKDLLISRLARYGNLCEIITPYLRNDMSKMINDALSNYGE